MKVKIPTDWSEVTLRQYIELCKVPDLGFDDWDSKLKELEILTGVSDDVFYRSDYSDTIKALSKVAFIRSKPEYKGIINDLKVNGKRFKVNYNPKELTTGEYIDCQTYIKGGTNKNLAKLIAIYLKPMSYFGIKKSCYKKNNEGKYIQTMESRAETEEFILDNLTMDKVFPISDFFLLLWDDLIKATQSYLESQKNKAMERVKVLVEDL